MDINSAIPTGEWSLYFHSPREKKWSLDTYSLITTVSTWDDMWAVKNELGDAKLKGGMFFWMRASVPPLWENHQNIKGGSYSLCVGATDSIDIFHRYTLGCMLGSATEKDDCIQGITISPKKGFHVIKLWNKDAARFSSQSGLAILDKRVNLAEVRYMPHVEKKM